MCIKNLLKNKKIYYLAVFVTGLFFFGCGSVSAATLKINSGITTLSVGDTATLYVVLNSEGIAVNNVEATIKFPTELFDVVSISKSGSIFSLWVEEPYFSNSSGVVTFNGGLPTPGFNGSQGPVVSIVVRAKKAGQADFVFFSAAVRANDGLGTDVLNNQQGKIITIIKGEEFVNVTPTTSNPALQISSLTHPNQNQWYKDENPVFQWTVPSDSDTVQTSIGSNISGIPYVTYSPVINKKTVENLKDGLWYFKVRARAGGVWGSISTYIVRIDTTAPQKKNVEFTYDDNVKILNITADIQDITSGIDHYEIFINDVLIKNIPAKDFVNGSYNLAFNASGNNSVRLLVIDRAGNSVDESGTFYSTAILAPQLDLVPSTVSVDEQLLVRGKIQNSDTDVIVNIKHDGNEQVTLKVKSNSDGSFFVLTPKLKSGNYDIWAEVGSGDKLVSSTHIYTKVTSRLLVTIGSFTITALSLIVLILIVILFLVLFAYYLGHHYIRFQHKQKMKTALVKGDNLKILLLLKKRLEKHLELLQDTRHGRILTKEEKEIKEAVEGDLDEVDRAIEEQK